MPKGINKIRQLAVERSLRAGKSAKQSLLDGGYTNATARKSTINKVVKVCQAKIKEEFMQTITPENVIKSLLHLKSLAVNKSDLSTAVRCDELIGKYLKMFSSNEINISQTFSKEDKEALERYKPEFTFIKTQKADA